MPSSPTLAYHPASTHNVHAGDDMQHKGFVESLHDVTQHGKGSSSGGRRHDNNKDSDRGSDGERSDDELFEELERELDEGTDAAAPSSNLGFDMGEFRERRMQQLRAEIENRQSQESVAPAHGILTEIQTEREAMKVLGEERRCVIHFYHKEFRRCSIMDKHLELLAPRHPNTRFLRLSVLNMPFLVTKLSIKVLPALVCIMDGKVRDILIGFEELGNRDTFASGTLEWRLSQVGVIDPPQRADQRPILGFASDPAASNGAGFGAGLAQLKNDDNDADDLDWE